MKKVTFTRLSIRNFLSVGEEPIEIKFDKGFNIITGYNKDENDIKNGVGKTLIIDALYFAIFGSTLRELSNQSYIINRQTTKNCKVILEFDNNSSRHGQDHFIIERSLAPKKLIVTKNGNDKTKSSIPETNKYIREVLSADEDIFQNCIIMRANNTIPFMLKNKSAKKNFIESIFNLSIFSDMLKDVRDDLRVAKHNYDITNTQYEVIDSNKLKYQEEIRRLQTEAEDKARKASTIITSIKEEIEQHKQKILELTEQAKAVGNYDSQIDEQMKIKSQANLYYQEVLKTKYQSDAKITTCLSQLDKISKESNICPTCKREFDENHKAHKEELISKLKSEVVEEKQKLTELTGKEDKLREIIENVNKVIQELSSKQSEVRYIANQITGVKQLIASKQDQINIYTSHSESESIKSFQDMLNKTLLELEEKQKEVTGCEQEITKLNICEHILGEYGIRAYIVNKLLELLNSRITFYLNKLKSTFKFTFNELFEDEIKDARGNLCSYGNCSGAEMKKIDLAISFAFIDILKYQQQLEYNVLFMDEILDSSLDTKSLEYVVDFLSEYVTQNNIGLYLITHKSDVNLPDINKIIVLEKRNGFTTLLEEQS